MRRCQCVDIAWYAAILEASVRFPTVFYWVFQTVNPLTIVVAVVRCTLWVSQEPFSGLDQLALSRLQSKRGDRGLSETEHGVSDPARSRILATGVFRQN